MDEASGRLFHEDEQIWICGVDDVEMHFDDHDDEQVYCVDCEACLEDVHGRVDESNDDDAD